MKRLLMLIALLVTGLCMPLACWSAVDLNTASESELESLPGIGPGKAKAIIADRQANGPFKSVDDLGRVKGIGAKTLAELRSQVTVGSAAPASPAAPSAAPASAGAAPATPPLAQPSRGLPWTWILIGVAVVGAGGWLLLRRRGAPAAPEAPQMSSPAPQAQPAPRPVPQPPAPASVATHASTPPPAPAGQRPAGATAAPPAPAGPKPAQSPAASAPPPAPAGVKPAGPKPAGPPGAGQADAPPAPAGKPPAPAGAKPRQQ